MEKKKRRQGNVGRRTKQKKTENSYGLENHRIPAIKPTLCEWVGRV